MSERYQPDNIEVNMIAGTPIGVEKILCNATEKYLNMLFLPS
jgi:hypothetical protein